MGKDWELLSSTPPSEWWVHHLPHGILTVDWLNNAVGINDAVQGRSYVLHVPEVLLSITRRIDSVESVEEAKRAAEEFVKAALVENVEALGGRVEWATSPSKKDSETHEQRWARLGYGFKWCEEHRMYCAHEYDLNGTQVRMSFSTVQNVDAWIADRKKEEEK